MAKKDTFNALIKRGIEEEVATLLIGKYSSLADMSAAGVEGLEAAGLASDIAVLVIEKIGKRAVRSTGKKAAPAKAEEPVEKVVFEEVDNPHVYTEAEKKLYGIIDKLGVTLPMKVVCDIAARIDNTGLDDETCEKIITVASRMYSSHLMDQNESAGVMAAHSIGEPGTQMNLRTFHFAGIASISVTQGLPRLIEIVDARREPSTPSMKIPLVGLAAEDENVAENVASNIEITSLLDVASVQTDITNMRLVIRPEVRKMDKSGITVDDIVEKLNKIKAVRGLVSKSEDFDIVIASDEPSFRKLQQMYDAIKNAKLKGIDGIKRAIIQKIGGRYSIVTEGSNLKEVLQVDNVDSDNVKTNSILEVADVLGIEAARNSIIEEAYGTLQEAGLDVDIRHIMLVADLMTNDGTVRAIGRHGVSGKKSSVLARAAFEITAAHLLHAAMVGETDNLEGVTENIIVGQPVTLGTGAVNIIYTPKKNEKGENE